MSCEKNKDEQTGLCLQETVKPVGLVIMPTWIPGAGVRMESSLSALGLNFLSIRWGYLIGQR